MKIIDASDSNKLNVVLSPNISLFRSTFPLFTVTCVSETHYQKFGLSRIRRGEQHGHRKARTWIKMVTTASLDSFASTRFGSKELHRAETLAAINSGENFAVSNKYQARIGLGFLTLNSTFTTSENPSSSFGSWNLLL